MCHFPVSVLAITIWLVMEHSESQPTEVGVIGLFDAKIDKSNQSEETKFCDSILNFLPW